MSSKTAHEARLAQEEVERAKLRIDLARKAMLHGIPEHMAPSLAWYIVNGRPVGHFLTAILTNDLREACNRADDENKPLLYQYIFFLTNFAPMDCWGSKENVAEWYERRPNQRSFRGVSLG